MKAQTKDRIDYGLSLALFGLGLFAFLRRVSMAREADRIMDCVRLERIQLDVEPGTTIADAISAGLRYAHESGCEVEMDFNDVKLVFPPMAEYKDVYEAYRTGRREQNRAQEEAEAFAESAGKGEA